MGLFGLGGNKIKKDLEFKQANISNITRAQRSVDGLLEDSNSVELKSLKLALNELKDVVSNEYKDTGKRNKENKQIEAKLDELFLNLTNVMKNNNEVTAEAANFIVQNAKLVYGYYFGAFSKCPLVTDKDYQQRFNFVLNVHKDLVQAYANKASLEKQKEDYKNFAKEEGISSKQLDDIMNKIKEINAKITPLNNEIMRSKTELQGSMIQMTAIANKATEEDRMKMKAAYSTSVSDLFEMCDLTNEKYTNQLVEESKQAIDYQNKIEERQAQINALNEQMLRGGQLSQEQALAEEAAQFEDEKTVEEKLAAIEKM